MKYVPQTITCPNCNRQGRIITEDVPIVDLVLQKNDNGSHTVLAHVECPICNERIDLSFISQGNVGNEVLFECNMPLNGGLQMWRMIVNQKPNPPEFHPNVGNRSKVEQVLDSHCKEIANLFHKWKVQPQQEQQLSRILEEVEDYTKKDSWRKFNYRHYVVNVCGEGGSRAFFRGFSGIFGVVKDKNLQLMNAFGQILGGGVDDKSNQFCKNPIGHCAEMHAANLCLNKVTSLSITDLRISISYTTRLGSSRPRSYCLNCITLFNLRNA